MTTTLPPFLSYPARPVNGGPLPKALPKRGRWFYEPKINGWRALVHTPTGRMWNRHGKPLSITAEFKTVLACLETCPLEWLDCEALERRHDLGRGSLVVLDTLDHAALPYTDRMSLLASSLIRTGAEPWADQFTPPPNRLLWFAYTYETEATQEQAGFKPDPDLDPAVAWNRLQLFNKAFGAEVFEGLVAKHADSPYPLQTRSADQTFPQWMKHRWAF